MGAGGEPEWHHTQHKYVQGSCQKEGGRLLLLLRQICPLPTLVYGNLTLSFQSSFPREVAQGHLDVLTRTRVEQYNPAWENLTIMTSFFHQYCSSM